MIIDPNPQGSNGWVRARLGIPTASEFSSIITPRTMKPSASADRYARRLLAEWALGHPVEEFSSGFMDRGHDLEEDASSWYALQRDVDPAKVGLCLRDDGRVGASPDRLVGDDGLLEIKCLSPVEHVAALLGDKDGDHRAQVQGQLWICERRYADLLFYNGTLPPVIVRVERDEEFIGALGAAVDAFLARLEEGKARLRALGCEPPTPVDPEAPSREEAAFSASLRENAGPVAEDGPPPPDLDISQLPF